MGRNSKSTTAQEGEAPPAPATPPVQDAPAPDAKKPESEDKDGDDSNVSAKGDSGPLDGVGEDMPTVQQHAVDAHTAEAAGAATAAEAAKAPASAGAGPKDNKGRSFDPLLHENDGGKPRLSSTGNLRCWRGGAGKGQRAANSRLGGIPPAGSAGPAPAPGPDIEAKIQSTAAVVSQMIFVIGQSVGGEEWAPKTTNGMDERAMMHGAWAEYFRAQGIVEIPPWAGLALVMGSYVGPRLFMPKTRTRVQAAKEWLYGTIGRWKARRNSARRTDSMRRDVEAELA